MKLSRSARHAASKIVPIISNTAKRGSLANNIMMIIRPLSSDPIKRATPVADFASGEIRRDIGEAATRPRPPIGGRAGNFL